MKAVVARERWALSRSQTTSSGVPIWRRTERRAWMTQRLEMEVRKWRAYNRPSGVIATMLDTSRRLLTRWSTGVSPRRAQVAPGRIRKLWPVSSQRTRVRCSRRAFFQSHPVPLGPDRDHQLIALLSPCGGTLHAEAMRLERPLQVARVVVDPELPRDQGGDALKRPPFAGKACRHRTPIQQPAQPRPGFLIKAGRWSRDGSRFQTARAFLGERGGPAADTGATDPHMPGNVCLRELSLAQQRRGHQATLLHLLRRQMRRPPNVAFHRAPPHDDGHRPMLHLSREDQ